MLGTRCGNLSGAHHADHLCLPMPQYRPSSPGKPYVVQIGVTNAPGLPTFKSLTTPSILTTALPLSSWPVITRRTFINILQSIQPFTLSTRARDQSCPGGSAASIRRLISRIFARIKRRTTLASCVERPCLKLPLRLPRGPPEPLNACKLNHFLAVDRTAKNGREMGRPLSSKLKVAGSNPAGAATRFARHCGFASGGGVDDLSVALQMAFQLERIEYR
jgi:hypothetical protein